MDHIIKKTYQTNLILLRQIPIAVYHFRIQNYDTALRLTADNLQFLGEYLELLSSGRDYFSELGEDYPAELLAILRELLNAQEMNDYILLADLYELQILPFLNRIQSMILQKETDLISVQYETNIRILNHMDAELSGLIGSESGIEELHQMGYSLELTNSGQCTLAICSGNKKYYLHSNHNPSLEAFYLANSWYDANKTSYMIYGLGLGYPVMELCGLVGDNSSIEIYESDLNIIKLACAYGDLGFLDEHPGVRIIYDPDYQKLDSRIKSMDEDMVFLMHFPSVRMIKNPTVRELFERYFVHYSSVKNQLPVLKNNFSMNTKRHQVPVDELKDSFTNKDLYIIAAGPSLDRNMQELKKVNRANSVILSVGTVFRKLLNANIIPDYVIVSDPNPRVYAQIAGLEHCNIPMLFLSTAYHGFAENYMGRKYIIYQSGFADAEALAGKDDLHCFRTGGSVSTTALDIGITFGCRRIIFLGLDLAYTENYAHASDTSRRNAVQTKDMRQVEDIHGTLINTSRSLDMYRVWIENRIKDVKEIEFIDATEGGARIKGMRIAKLADLLAE